MAEKLHQWHLVHARRSLRPGGADPQAGRGSPSPAARQVLVGRRSSPASPLTARVVRRHGILLIGQGPRVLVVGAPPRQPGAAAAPPRELHPSVVCGSRRSMPGMWPPVGGAPPCRPRQRQHGQWAPPCEARAQQPNNLPQHFLNKAKEQLRLCSWLDWDKSINWEIVKLTLP
jgi:hypothetical protein